jgi:Tol biopolymer transport system component
MVARFPLFVRYDLESQRTEASEVCCAPLSLKPGGSEVLVNTSSDDSFGLGWLDLETGQVVKELSLPRDEPRQHQYRDISLSPDARTLLLGSADGAIYRYAVGSGEFPVPFVSSAASPAWSPDGSKVVYTSLPASGDYYSGQLVIANADGSSPEPLFSEPQPRGMLSPAWSPDGTQIAFVYGTEHSNRILVAEVPESLRPAGILPGATSATAQ